MKRLFLLLLSLLIVISGCIFGDDNNDNNGNPAGSYQATDYFPLETGSVFSYQRTDMYFGGTLDTYDYTMTVTETTEIEGHTYYILLNEYDDWTETTYAAIRDNIFWIYEESYTKTALSRSQMPATAKAAVIGKIASPDDHMPIMDFNQTSWDISSDSGQGEDYSYTFTMSGSFEGLENVTTPSGSYANCLKFHLTSTSSTTWTYEGETDSWNEVMHEYFYLAKGIGLVKHVEQYIDEENATQDSYTEVLTGYTKPNGSAVQ